MCCVDEEASAELIGRVFLPLTRAEVLQFISYVSAISDRRSTGGRLKKQNKKKKNTCKISEAAAAEKVLAVDLERVGGGFHLGINGGEALC